MRTSYYEKIKRYFEFILILAINVSSKKEKTIIIRDDAKGYFFGENDPQNRCPHFNDPKGGYYDY